MTKYYLVQVQVENIQDYIFGYLNLPENYETFKMGREFSKNVSEILNDLKKPEYFKEEDKLVDTSGKFIYKISDEKINYFKDKLKKKYFELKQKNIDISYYKTEIENDNIMEAYAKLVKLKNNSGSLLDKIINDEIMETEDKTEKLKSDFNYKKIDEVDKLVQIPGVKLLEEFTEEGKNQIAIIKGDLNNLGNYFKKINDVEKLKESSKAINEIFDGISKKRENDFFTLYAAGDDIFIISKVEAIQKALGFIKEKVSDINKELKKIFPTQEDTLITVGVGVLTTDYRSTFRYYLEKVEQLESEAKADKSKNYFNINGMIVDEEGLTDFFQTVNLETANSNGVKQSTSMLHNILEIAKEATQDLSNNLDSLKLKIREMQYILTKEHVGNNLQKKLFNKLNNIYTNEKLEDFVKELQNIILFVRYSVIEKNCTITKESSDQYIPEYKIKNEVEIEKVNNTIVVFDNQGNRINSEEGKIKIELNCKIYNQKEPIKSRGFWFKLESLLSNTVDSKSKVNKGEYILHKEKKYLVKNIDNNGKLEIAFGNNKPEYIKVPQEIMVLNDNLEKFLANYQYQNKKIVSWEFSDESSKKIYYQGNEPADGDRRAAIRNYMNFEGKEAKNSKQKRDNYIKSIVKDMEKNKDQWRIKCREEIIKLNIEKRNGVKKNGKN